MEVQYITNASGERTAVVIPIDEWYGLTAKYPEVERDVDGLPQWQKDLIDERLALMRERPQDPNIRRYIYAGIGSWLKR